MPVTDPIADMLTRIRNALVAKKDIVEMPASNGFLMELFKPIVCFKTIKVTKQGYRQDRQQRENRVLSSHIWWQIWWQNGGCFSA